MPQTSQIINIPGLLQTPEYMRALFATGLLRRSEEARENQIKARQICQELRYVEYPAGSFHAEKDDQVHAARLVHDHLRSAAPKRRGSGLWR